MIFVLDTSVLIDISNKKEAVINKIKEISKDSSIAKITFINDFEFRYGLRDKNEKNQMKLLEFIHRFPMLNTTPTTPIILSDLKSKYEMSLTDLMIAALTIENNHVLITRDNDFSKIKELKKIIIQ
jgi:predicted nucleic acid-binding protein